MPAIYGITVSGSLNLCEVEKISLLSWAYITLQSDLLVVGVYGEFANFLGSPLVLKPRSVSMGKALPKEWYTFFL